MENKTNHLLVPNPNFKTDVDFAFKLNRIILYYTATWYSQSSFSNIIKKLINFLHICLMTTFMIGFFIDFIRNLDIDSSDLVDKCTLFLVFLGYMAKHVVTIFYSSRIRICYDVLENDWQFILVGSYEIMKKGAKFGRNLTVYYTMFLTATFFSWHTNALSQKAIVRDGVKYHILGYPCNFMFFDVRLFPYYPFVYIFQLYVVTVTLAAMCQNCTGAAFIAHTTAQCKVLVFVLKEVSRDAHNSERVHVMLSYVVKKHNEIMRFMSLFNSIFTWVYLTEWIACISTLLLACYLALTKPLDLPNLMRNISLFVTGTNTFSVLCYVGEQYTHMSAEFGNLFLFTNWYRFPKKSVISCAIINLYGKEPGYMTAGKIINLTMETFSDVMKRTMAFFNVLKNTL